MTEEYMRSLSQNLCCVLDVAGASEYVRRSRQHSYLVSDVLTTLRSMCEGSSVALYTFGSSSEGTTTPELGSDLDTMMCFRILPVFESQTDVLSENLLRIDSNHGNVTKSRYLLMVNDDYTPLGFTKLQFVVSDEDKEEYEYMHIEKDVNGKEVLNNIGIIEAMTQDERNGPAATMLEKPGFTDLDYIPSFRCSKWPVCANEFITRTRHYGFPSEDVYKDFGSLGIFLVPTGHPGSPERHLQWRISFSLQERKIMLNLNETQYKCYILLKMMKVNFIKPVVPEKSLTSYHCKTSLFFLMETTEPSAWTTDYLVQNFERCVHRLRKWISDGFIPCYFLPLVNLWKGTDDSRRKVLNILDSVLLDVPKALMKIRCDRVGELLLRRIETALDCTSPRTQNQQDSSDFFRDASRGLHRAVYRLHYTFIDEIVASVRELIQHTRKGDNIDKCIESHRRLIATLENKETLSNVTSHDIEVAVDAASYVLPFLYTSYGSQLYAKARKTSDKMLEQEAMEYLKSGTKSDFLSGKVKLAAILFAQRKYKQCLRILEELDRNLEKDVITVGMCHTNPIHKMLVNEALLDKILSERLSSKDILLNHTATCVVYLPTEFQLIPRDLQYEIFRSFGAKTELIPDVQDWYEIVTLDSKIFLYYLLYRTQEKLENFKKTTFPFLCLKAILETDYNLCHFDTANNLLGCLLKDMCDLKAALAAFLESWFRKPEHNAAKWHGLITCFEYYKLTQAEYNEDFSKVLFNEKLETEELYDEGDSNATEEIIYKRTND